MVIKNSNSQSTVSAPEAYFTGAAWIDALMPKGSIACNVARVTFEPGARNFWHTHPAGQVLLVTAGKGYVQKRGEPIQLILPGDAVTILAGEEHWHGAAPDSIFTHIAIQPLGEQGQEITWLEPVAEEEYRAGPVGISL
jgi:quercetin dioxygenase-like cupin family protein